MDEFAINCHAHAHLFISIETVEWLTEQDIKAIKRRYYKPEAYFETEANALEPRIISRE